MPELAEVEFYRKQWDCGLGGKIVRLHVNAAKRDFRGTDGATMVAHLSGARLISSEARGKQMLFRFSGNA